MWNNIYAGGGPRCRAVHGKADKQRVGHLILLKECSVEGVGGSRAGVQALAQIVSAKPQADSHIPGNGYTDVKWHQPLLQHNSQHCTNNILSTLRNTMPCVQEVVTSRSGPKLENQKSEVIPYPK